MSRHEGSQGSTPEARQKEGKDAKRHKLRMQALNLAIQSAVDHVKELQHTSDAITDLQWPKDVRFYLNYLIIGGQLPADVRQRLGEDTLCLVREWVRAACETTGLSFPRRS